MNLRVLIYLIYILFYDFRLPVLNFLLYVYSESRII